MYLNTYNFYTLIFDIFKVFQKKTFVSNIMTGTHYDIQSRLLNKFFKNSVGISSLEESENLDTPQIGHFATIILYF